MADDDRVAALISASDAIHKAIEPVCKAHGLDDFVVIAAKGKRMVLTSSLYEDHERIELMEEAIDYLGTEPDEIVRVQ